MHQTPLPGSTLSELDRILARPRLSWSPMRCLRTPSRGAQREHDGADHGDQQDHPGRLEGIDVVGIEDAPKRVVLVTSPAGGVGAADHRAPRARMPSPAKTSTSSASRTMPISAPIGRYCRKPWRSSTKLMSSIITTNRNSTATAPT